MPIGDIAFGVATAFLTGVLAANLGWPINIFASLVFIGGLIWLVWLLVQKRPRPRFRRLWKFAVLFFAVMIFGAFYFHFYLHWQAAHTNLPTGKLASFSAIVSDEPKSSVAYLYFPATTQTPYRGTIMVFVKLFSAANIHYGDLLKIDGEIAAPKTPTDSPAAFPKTVTVLATGRGFWLRAAMLNFKAAVLARFREFLSPDAAALLGGITFGGTGGMGAALKNDMAASGTSYVTSMYGYKMYVVAWVIEEALKHRLVRRGRFALAVLAIALFVAMAGAAAVVVRAAIFAFLAIAAREIGRPLAKRNALAVVAGGMAALDPTIVIQFGFALSFLSVAGIMYLMDPLKKLLRWDRTGMRAGTRKGASSAGGATAGNASAGTATGAGFLRWRESVLMAVATLLPIIPVIVADSGNLFSLAIFISNALIGIATPAAVAAGYALAAVGFLPALIARPLVVIVAKFANLVVLYDFVIIKIFAAFTLPVPLYFNSVAAFAIYYGGLGCFAWYFSVNKKERRG